MHVVFYFSFFVFLFSIWNERVIGTTAPIILLSLFSRSQRLTSELCHFFLQMFNSINQVLQLKMLVVPVAPDNSDTDSNASDTEGNDGPDDLTMDPVIPYWHFFNTCHVMLTLMSGGGGGGSSIHAMLSSNVLSGQERRHQLFSIPAFKVKKD